MVAYLYLKGYEMKQTTPELLIMLERFLDEYLSRDPIGGQVSLLTIEQAQAVIKKAKGEI